MSQNQANTIVRDQVLSFTLVREGKISNLEAHLLMVINSFSNGIFSTKRCEHTLDWIGKAIQKSRSTVIRGINSLVRKGIITKRYGIFKTLVLKIVPLEEQEKLRGAGMLKKITKRLFKYTKRKRNSSDVSSVKHPDVSPMELPIKNKEFKELKMNIEKNFDLKPLKRSLEEEKQRQIALMREKFPTLSI